MKAVNHSRRGVLNPAPFSFVLLLCCLTVGNPLAATSLFDPKRGEMEQAPPATDAQTEVTDQSETAGGPMQNLQLDGILLLGDSRRVMITGPQGQRFRFNWQGNIKNPLLFEGESVESMKGYRLVSAGDRSVWLQLPRGIACEPRPEKGVMACDQGKVQLALMRRAAPPEVASKDKPAGPKLRPVNPGKRINPFTGQPLGGPSSTDSAPAKKRRIIRKKSQAQLQAEALKKKYRENNRRILQERKQNAAESLPPGFKSSGSLFGQSKLVKDSPQKKPVAANPDTAASRVKALKELYRQRNLEQLQQGYTGSFGFGQAPKKAE